MKQRTDYKQQRKTHETKSYSFEKINKINKSLARWTKKKKKTQITNIRNESGDSAIDSTEIKRIISKYCEQAYISII